MEQPSSRKRSLATAILACSLLALLAAAWAHPFRLSIADVRVTDSALEVRLRFFWDDLELAVMEHSSNMEFVLAQTPEVERVIEEYINDMLAIRTGDALLQGSVTGSGVEDAPRLEEVMWWYRLEYSLPPSTDRIHIRNRLLFNMFEDQRNVVHLKTRSGAERAYYFGYDEDSVLVRVK